MATNVSTLGEGYMERDSDLVLISTLSSFVSRKSKNGREMFSFELFFSNRVYLMYFREYKVAGKYINTYSLYINYP